MHVARHLVRTRALQKETGGFTEFVPLPFVHMATPIYLQRQGAPGPTFREVLLMHAVGRIAYRGWIDNVQVSWVKTGVTAPARRSRPAATTSAARSWTRTSRARPGAATARSSTSRSFRAIVEPLGRPLEQRTTLYGRTHTKAVGCDRRRGRPTDAPTSVPVSAASRRTGRAAVDRR